MTCDPSQWNSPHSRARQTVDAALDFVEHAEYLGAPSERELYA